MNSGKRRSSASVPIVIFVCVAADIILHRLVGRVFGFDYFTNNLPQSMFVKSGTFPFAAAVGFALMFSFLTAMYLRLLPRSGMTPLALGLRFFVPIAVVMFFGVLEPWVVFDTPFRSDFITAIADAVPFVILGVLLSRVARHDLSTETVRERKPVPWPAMVWIALFFVVGRYLSYAVIGISSGYLERAAGTFVWTVGCGLAMGSFYLFAGRAYPASTPASRSLQAGALTLGVFQLTVQLFYALIFDVSVADLVIRSVADTAYLVAGIFSYEKLFGKKRTGNPLATAVVAVAAIAALSGCATSGVQDELAVENIDFKRISDGTYQGEQSSFPVSANVEATVAGGRLESAVALRHTHGPGHGAEAILERAVAGQSLMVDAVSGSTRSSKVMLKALETALRKGLRP